MTLIGVNSLYTYHICDIVSEFYQHGVWFFWKNKLVWWNLTRIRPSAHMLPTHKTLHRWTTLLFEPILQALVPTMIPISGFLWSVFTKSSAIAAAINCNFNFFWSLFWTNPSKRCVFIFIFCQMLFRNTKKIYELYVMFDFVFLKLFLYETLRGLSLHIYLVDFEKKLNLSNMYEAIGLGTGTPALDLCALLRSVMSHFQPNIIVQCITR